MTLFVHEVHRVIGTREDDFESACKELMRGLGTGGDARLLGYWSQAHGTGPSYRVVTLTAVDGWAAWERVARSAAAQERQAELDGLRHDVVASVFEPLPWSPLVGVDLSTVPSEPGDRPHALLMEDTMWPHRGKLFDYLEGAGSYYTELLARPGSLLRLDLALRAAIGDVPSVMLLQTVKDPKTMIRLFSTEIEPAMRPPGSWMHDALEWRDQWQSRLLRSARWAPWPALPE